MSCNEETFVMRNGHSTSQVSVYNYPEHLNPFYEEDQHKRLRFWKTNKNFENGSRKKSLSIISLKDLWSFQPFKLKKKSSTLGINKTSESPPPLRRDLGKLEQNNFLSPIDQRGRYTISATSSPNPTNKYFVRNATYRSSLDNVYNGRNSNQEIGFNRNDRYRSTTQFPGSAHTTKTLSTSPSIRSSQCSLGSTNPFDTDDEFSENSFMGNSARKSYRKKSKAPPPPQNSTHNKENDSSQLYCNNSNEEIKIKNLTAEIEQFVKSTSNDNADEGKKQVEVVSEDVNSNSDRTELLAQAKCLSNVELRISEIDDTKKGENHNKQAIDELVEKDIAVTPTSSSKSKESRELLEEVLFKCEATTPTRQTIEGEPSQINEKIILNSVAATESKPEEAVEHIIEEIPDKHITATSKRHQENIVHNKEVINVTTLTRPVEEVVKVEIVTVKNKPIAPPRHKIENEHVSELPVVKRKPATPPRTKGEVGHVECIHVHVPSPRTTPERKPSNQLTSFQSPEKRSSEQVVTNKTMFLLAKPLKRTENQSTNNDSVKTNINTLNINDSNIRTAEDTSDKHIGSLQVNKQRKEQLPIKLSNENSETVENQLKISESKENFTSVQSRTIIPNVTADIETTSLLRTNQQPSYLQWKQSSLAPLELHIPPEKRRSVKDIIESINRNQMLLNVNSEKRQQQSHKENQQSGPGLLHHDDNSNQLEVHHHHNIVVDDVSPNATNGDITKKINLENNELHHYNRESSPTASNLDWNPLPKPKRAKNLF